MTAVTVATVQVSMFNNDKICANVFIRLLSIGRGICTRMVEGKIVQNGLDGSKGCDRFYFLFEFGNQSPQLRALFPLLWIRRGCQSISVLLSSC